jgi:tetratricopeptide (TPR) repeat protein
MRPEFLFLCLLVPLGACASGGERALPPGTEARSLLGEALYSPELPAELRAEREAALRAARSASAAAPGDLERLLWVGRRLGYLNRFREAIALFTRATEEHPDDPRPWRFRGHRYITVRELERAEHDLECAAALLPGRPDEIEPAGLPNARGIELDYLHHSVWYHLALARYLRGDLERALEAWQRCRDVSRNADALCSATHWLYMTLRRLGRDEEAQAALGPISADMDVVEYHAYHRLLLVYRGELDADELWQCTQAEALGSVDAATIGYGVGNWHLYHGRTDRARAIFQEVLANPSWPAFGAIASEAELARLGN